MGSLPTICSGPPMSNRALTHLIWCLVVRSHAVTVSTLAMVSRCPVSRNQSPCVSKSECLIKSTYFKARSVSKRWSNLRPKYRRTEDKMWSPLSFAVWIVMIHNQTDRPDINLSTLSSKPSRHCHKSVNLGPISDYAEVWDLSYWYSSLLCIHSCCL